MTTLLQRCENVASEVRKLALAQRHASQQQQVQERSREWSKSHGALMRVQARIACLTLPAEARRRVDEKREHLRHNATRVLDRLQSLGDIAELTADDAWMRLLASVEGLAEEIENAGRTAWRACIDEQGTLETPEWQRSRAPMTPGNREAIAAYEKHYDTYANLVKQGLPRGESDVAQLLQAIAACRAEAAEITFDVPPDVQRFFQAIQLGNATLACITTGVLQWLAENELLDRYRIRSVAQ
jgi:hypothetical protein